MVTDKYLMFKVEFDEAIRGTPTVVGGVLYVATEKALYAFKRLAWWPYSVAMRRVNVLFTRALRPNSVAPKL